MGKGEESEAHERGRADLQEKGMGLGAGRLGGWEGLRRWGAKHIYTGPARSIYRNILWLRLRGNDRNQNNGWFERPSGGHLWSNLVWQKSWCPSINVQRTCDSVPFGTYLTGVAYGSSIWRASHPRELVEVLGTIRVSCGVLVVGCSRMCLGQFRLLFRPPRPISDDCPSGSGWKKKVLSKAVLPRAGSPLP